MFGTVTEIRDDSVVLEVSPGVTMRFAKAAVGRVVTDGRRPTTTPTTPTTTADDADTDRRPTGTDDAQAGRGRTTAAE